MNNHVNSHGPLGNAHGSVSSPDRKGGVAEWNGYFETIPYLILLPNDPVCTIVAVIRAGSDRILGRGFFELFPPSRNENSGTMPVTKYALPTSDGSWEERRSRPQRCSAHGVSDSRSTLLFASHSFTEPPAGSASLSAALSLTLGTLQPVIGDSHAFITADVLPVVARDEGQLAQVLENLIPNALKYRNESEAPAIRAENEWLIEVKENGIGFGPQYAQNFFGLFKRLHREAYRIALPEAAA